MKPSPQSQATNARSKSKKQSTHPYSGKFRTVGISMIAVLMSVTQVAYAARFGVASSVGTASLHPSFSAEPGLPEAWHAYRQAREAYDFHRRADVSVESIREDLTSKMEKANQLALEAKAKGSTSAATRRMADLDINSVRDQVRRASKRSLLRMEYSGLVQAYERLSMTQEKSEGLRANFGDQEVLPESPTPGDADDVRVDGSFREFLENDAGLVGRLVSSLCDLVLMTVTSPLLIYCCHFDKPEAACRLAGRIMGQ